jgi:DNA-binding NtrC family response regulator
MLDPVRHATLSRRSRDTMNVRDSAGRLAGTPTVAVINASEEIAEMLSMVLQHAGIPTVMAYPLDFKRGRQDLAIFLTNYDPPVVVFDIAIPYAENWAFFERVRDSAAGRGRTFIVTTTNKRALEEIVGGTGAHEIIGKPYDLDAIVDAVRRALVDQQRRGRSVD